MTKSAPIACLSSVLIIDQSAECREVLATLLRRRGVQTWETAEANEALCVLARHHPQVVVLDMESDAAHDEQIRERYDGGADQDTSAYILLGRARRGDRPAAVGHVVAKPYHYAPLIRTIEQLLGR